MPSPLEELFQKVFGYMPVKSGAAYEIFSAIAAHAIDGGEVKSDIRLRGELSETMYQLDVHQKVNGRAFMGEAKDYSDRNGKVGRGDLQKLGGALPDLQSIHEGRFFSSTGYTKPAKQYADAAENIIGKPIRLFGLRESTEYDEEGLIRTVVIKMMLMTPKMGLAKFTPHFTSTGNEKLRALLQPGEHQVQWQAGLSCFYDAAGNPILSLWDLTSLGYGELFGDTMTAYGTFLLSGLRIKVRDILADVNGLEYEVPFEIIESEIQVTYDSKNRLVITDSNGKILLFLTEDMLKQYSTDADGNIRKET